MEYIEQTILGSKDGNCYTACMAMILDVSIDDLPNFCLLGEDWHQKTQDYLKFNYGVSLIQISESKINDILNFMTGDVYCIASGFSSRDCRHAVIAKTRKTRDVIYIDKVYDPHPSQQFLTSIECYEFLIKMNQE